MILAGHRPGALDTIPARDVLDVMFVVLAEQARRDDEMFIMLGHLDQATMKHELDRTLGMTLEEYEVEEEEPDEPEEIMGNLYQLNAAVNTVNQGGVGRG